MNNLRPKITPPNFNNGTIEYKIKKLEKKIKEKKERFMKKRGSACIIF